MLLEYFDLNPKIVEDHDDWHGRGSRPRTVHEMKKVVDRAILPPHHPNPAILSSALRWVYILSYMLLFISRSTLYIQ